MEKGKLLHIYTCDLMPLKRGITFTETTSMLLWKTLLILMFILPVKLEEPHCSKYDFEEKVLEKMVRMEFQMEKMKSEIIEDEIKRLQALKDEVEIPTVAFKARLNTDSTANTGQALVFPTTLFNEGGAYNAVTGKFTAPVNGTYMFSIAFCVFKEKLLVAGILVDGDKYTVAVFYGDANHECLTADTVAVLTAGQMVWVEALSGTYSGTKVDQDTNYRWNTFSGTLLHK